MKHRRRVFHKKRQRRTPWRLLLLSVVTLFASAPAAVPKAPDHKAAGFVQPGGPPHAAQQK